MKNYVVYDADGRILQTGSCPASMIELQAAPGRNIVEGVADQVRQWVSGGTLVDRPIFSAHISGTAIAADGSSVVTLAGLPSGVDIQVIGPAQLAGVTDGSDIHLTFLLPGDYKVAATQFPYQDFEVTVHAT